jgi:hypothetical protein
VSLLSLFLSMSPLVAGSFKLPCESNSRGVEGRESFACQSDFDVNGLSTWADLDRLTADSYSESERTTSSRAEVTIFLLMLTVQGTIWSSHVRSGIWVFVDGYDVVVKREFPECDEVNELPHPRGKKRV